jgi:hypothetical protein
MGGTDPKTTDKPAASAGQKLGVVATIVALGLIVMYFVFLILQWGNVGAADLPWSRRSDLFGGVEALAFSAAGALLGTTVQRQVTKKAEDQAADAKKEADTNKKDAEKGRALHHLAVAKAEQAGGAESAVRGAGGGPSAGGDVGEFLRLAESYER